MRLGEYVTDVASDKEGGYDETRMGALLEICTVNGHWVIGQIHTHTHTHTHTHRGSLES